MSIEDLLNELVQQGRYKQIYNGFGDRGSDKDIDAEIENIKSEICRRFYTGQQMS